MEQFQYICDDLKDNNEIAIIDTYGDIANRCTTALTSKITFFISYPVSYFK